jgi:hypothetical protein
MASSRGPARAVEARRLQTRPARFTARSGFVGRDADRADAGSALEKAPAGERIGLRVDDQTDRPLAKQRDGLRAMAPHAREPHLAERGCQVGGGAVGGGEFEKRVAREPRHRRRVEQLDSVARDLCRRVAVSLGLDLEVLTDLALEQEQRAHRVRRGAPVRRLPKDVVEDLERQRPGVAGAQHQREIALEIELALPRETAMVARPLDDVHRQDRRVGHLQEEDLLARDRRDRRRSSPSDSVWKLSRISPRCGWSRARRSPTPGGSG